MSNDVADVLIVGAGVAGLAAARELSAKGLSVVVVEARQRIGGRIDTVRDGKTGSVMELGAEFIHGCAPELLRLVKEAGLKIEEVTGRHWYLKDGKLTRTDEFFKQIDSIMDAISRVDHDMSFRAFLEILPNDENIRRAKQAAIGYVEGFHAASIDRIGTEALKTLNQASDAVDGDRAFRVREGYDQLPRWLCAQAAKAGARFHLNTIVSKIGWAPKGCSVTCLSSLGTQSFDCQKVVITVPLKVLQSNSDHEGAISFSPSLPEETRSAIQHLAMGSVMRVVLEFADRFWEQLDLPDTTRQADLTHLGFIHYPEVPFPTWWTTNPDKSAMLVGWSGGPSAEQLPATQPEIEILAIESVARMFGTTVEFVRERLIRFGWHDWRGDPFSRGGYCYVPVESGEAQASLSKPVGNTLFFAGEATSIGHIGTVHGALQSGLRVSKQVVESLRV